jgi:hypothetical protein
MDFGTWRAVFSIQRADIGSSSRTSSSLSRTIGSFRADFGARSRMSSSLSRTIGALKRSIEYRREKIGSLRTNHGSFSPDVSTPALNVSCQTTGGILQWRCYGQER